VRCGANLSQYRLNHCESQCSEVHEIVLEAAGFLSRPAAFLYPKFPFEPTLKTAADSAVRPLRPAIDSSTMCAFFTG
jgi:hypothetical protein